MRIGHELVRPDTREVCTLVEHTLMPRDLPYGGHAVQRRVLAEAVQPWTTPGFDDIPPPTRRGRMIDRGPDPVNAWELAERGRVSPSGPLHRLAHALPPLY